MRLEPCCVPRTRSRVLACHPFVVVAVCCSGSVIVYLLKKT
jgi:hypothetical protein